MADGFEVHVNVLLDAIQVCRAEGLLVPALILLYAAMDGLAWLNLPDENEAVQRKDFEAWADRYFVPEMKARGYREITAGDLYAARCALVHTQTAETHHTQEPKNSTAHEIYYRDKDGSGMVNLMANSPRPALLVAPSDLIASLEQAIGQIRREMVQDQSLANRILRRTAKHFANVTFQ
jgi:hypothetical protein